MHDATEAGWRRYFAEIVVSGDSGEIDAAVRAALSAVASGASEAQAKSAGKAEARRYRGGRTASAASPGWSGTARRDSGPQVRVAEPAPFGAGAGDWPAVLAPRLFAAPARWGWQAAAVAERAPTPPPSIQLGTKPSWVETPHPDTGALQAARSRAVQQFGVRLTLAVVAFLAFGVYQVAIKSNVSRYGGSDAMKVYGYIVLGAGALLVLWLLGSVAAIRRASASLRAFRQPYLAMRASERQRHQQALREWEAAKTTYDAQVRAAEQAEVRRRSGPLWYPVHPASEPTRVDVFGGDPRRHGWSSLLVTLGTSLLLGGHRITVLDFTGQEVGGGLVRVARTNGLAARWETLTDRSELDLLGGLSDVDLAECLAHALTGRAESGADVRQERALAADVLRRVAGCLEEPVTFPRLAAGIRVLLRSSDVEVLAPGEVGRLVAGIGDIDQNEWTSRHLRFWAGRLEILDRLAGGPRTRPLWSGDRVSVIGTRGGRDDGKELLDRLMVQLAQHAMHTPDLSGSFLVVAGADQLGAETVNTLSEHARYTGTRLVLFISQPQGDIEKTVGTGGAVCIMKMYNHRDANIAAEFIGKGHKFVVSQVTQQVGRSFSDGGQDSFSAATTAGSGTSNRRLRTERSTTDSRGHTWAGTRTWSSADNIGTSTGSTRVYEFITDPQEILGMPETAFILVDNSGHGRRVVMADSNPGICLLDRVSSTPAQGAV